MLYKSEVTSIVKTGKRNRFKLPAVRRTEMNYNMNESSGNVYGWWWVFINDEYKWHVPHTQSRDGVLCIYCRRHQFRSPSGVVEWWNSMISTVREAVLVCGKRYVLETCSHYARWRESTVRDKNSANIGYVSCEITPTVVIQLIVMFVWGATN